MTPETRGGGGDAAPPGPADLVATPDLPAHIDQTVRTIAKLHADHYAGATPLERLLETTTARAARPSFIVGLFASAFTWMAINALMVVAGLKPLDAPPFFWMQGAVSLAALTMTSLIVTTQRREDELASHREKLTLELGILSEQKAAKIIQLLEEMRRDHPNLADRFDPEAAALSMAADPQAVLHAIKESHHARGDDAHDADRGSS